MEWEQMQRVITLLGEILDELKENSRSLREINKNLAKIVQEEAPAPPVTFTSVITKP